MFPRNEPAVSLREVGALGTDLDTCLASFLTQRIKHVPLQQPPLS